MESIAITWQKIKTNFKILLKNGVASTKSTNQTGAISKPKILKLIVAIILSNVFFFMLFSGTDEKTTTVKASGIEIIIEGKLMTSFEENKEVLLTHPASGMKIKGRLLTHQNSDTHYLVLVSEEEAQSILNRASDWNILPYLKNFRLIGPKKIAQEIDHEIHF